MKTLNLNIKLDEPVKSDDGKEDLSPCKVATRWIGIMLERAINKPDIKTMRPTVGVTMEIQRKYFKVMDGLDAHKNGIVELEDDDFGFLDRKFHQAEMPLQRNLVSVLVQIEDAINTAKINKN